MPVRPDGRVLQSGFSERSAGARRAQQIESEVPRHLVDDGSIGDIKMVDTAGIKTASA